jgi:GT2 family glycosyltransferase
MLTFKNFNWSKTNTELLLLIPNFGRGKYVRRLLDNLIKTKSPKDGWKILIINDAIHEDFSDLEKDNVLYFTLERNPAWERGDGFTRNIAIKHSQSKLIAQKDPEIYYTGDFINGCLDHTDVLYRCGGQILQARQQETEEFLSGSHNINRIVQTSRAIPIMEDRFVFYHYGWCINRESLINIGGYDENYKYYCWADKDLHERLMKTGIKQYFDHSCQPIHLWHEKPDTKHDPVAIKRELANKHIYESKKNGSIIRNIGINWGEGDLHYVPEII